MNKGNHDDEDEDCNKGISKKNSYDNHNKTNNKTGSCYNCDKNEDY